MLFSDRSIWTMLHGIGFGGGALLALAAALFALYLMYPRMGEGGAPPDRSGAIAGLTGFTALLLWLTTLVGMYVVFPPYRATPPEGTTDLAAYPRALILGDPSTAWLHAFAMETKEHLPLIACILATAVAFVAWRYRRQFVADAGLRRGGAAMLAITFAIVAYISLLGVFINKVAPLE
jgi:hypothetical protein